MRLADLEVGDTFHVNLGDNSRLGRVLSKSPGSIRVEYPKYETVRFERSNGREVSFSRAKKLHIAPSTQVTPI